MAFPVTSVLDDFNRADAGTLGSDWTEQVGGSSHGISSNQAYRASIGGGQPLAIHTTLGVVGPDGEVFCDVPTMPGAGGAIAIYFRYDDVNANGYGAYILNSGSLVCVIFRLDSGSATTLQTISSAGWTNGDQFGLEVIGDTLKVYRNGSDVSSGGVTDSTYTDAGYIGMSESSSSVRVDNFGGGTVSTTDNLSASDSTLSALLGDTPALGQKHALSASDASLSALLGDAPALGQTHVLSTNDSTLSSIVGDTPSLSQIHALGANDSNLSAIVGDAPALGQVHVLSANDSALSEAVGDAPALGQVHSLAASDSALASVVGDTPALGQEHSLGASDTTLAGVIGDTPTLSTSGIDNLSASDATLSAILGDTPAVSQTHVLSADGVDLAGISGDSVALVQVHVLSASDVLLEALLGDTPVLSITGVDNLSASDVLLSAILGDKPDLSSAERMHSKFFDEYFRQRKKLIKGKTSRNSHDIVL